ncbi:MAG: hypothetical protein R2826_01955 [Thermoleophilia bacterium]
MSDSTVTIAVKVALAVSRELADDYVEMWELPVHIRHAWPRATNEEVCDLALSILSGLIASGVVLGDLDGDSGKFLPWSEEDPVGRAGSEWRRLGRDPNIGEIGWLA